MGVNEILRVANLIYKSSFIETNPEKFAARKNGRVLLFASTVYL